MLVSKATSCCSYFVSVIMNEYLTFTKTCSQFDTFTTLWAVCEHLVLLALSSDFDQPFQSSEYSCIVAPVRSYQGRIDDYQGGTGQERAAGLPINAPFCSWPYKSEENILHWETPEAPSVQHWLNDLSGTLQLDRIRCALKGKLFFWFYFWRLLPMFITCSYGFTCSVFCSICGLKLANATYSRDSPVIHTS